MKLSIIKKSLVGMLAVTLLVAPAMSAAAVTQTQTQTQTPVSVISSSTGGTVTSVAQVPTTSSVAGVKSTVAGVYLATNVAGSVVSTPTADISAAYGLTGAEKAYVKFMNMDAKKSNLAYECLKLGAASVGGQIGPMVNIELGKMLAGKFSLLTEGLSPVTMSVGIPANFFEAGKKYAMVRVRSGGIIKILEDIDSNPNTVTFNTSGGAGAYAIIKY